MYHAGSVVPESEICMYNSAHFVYPYKLYPVYYKISGCHSLSSCGFPSALGHWGTSTLFKDEYFVKKLSDSKVRAYAL